MKFRINKGMIVHNYSVKVQGRIVTVKRGDTANLHITRLLTFWHVRGECPYEIPLRYSLWFKSYRAKWFHEPLNIQLEVL